MEVFAIVPLMILLWLPIVWVAYMVIKAAVRNGILEADVRRGKVLRQQRAAALRRELEAEGAVADGRIVASPTTSATGAPDPL